MVVKYLFPNINDGENILVNNIDLTESNAVILVKEHSNQDDNKFIELLCVNPL